MCLYPESVALWDASRRRAILVVTSAALVMAAVSLTAWVGSASEGGPRWSVGDFWTFTTAGVDFHTTIREEVMEQTTLSTPAGAVLVWRLEATSTQLDANGTPVGSTFTDEYYLTPNLGLVRVDREVPPYRILYSPTNGSWPFPLNSTSIWSGSVHTTYWWTPDGSNQQNTTTPFDFRAAGDGIVSVPAGTFRAIGVSGDFLGLWRSGYIAQYADAVGYIVRDDLTDGQGHVLGYYELTAYRYQAGTPARTLILGATLGIDAGTVGVAVWLLLRRRKARPGASPTRVPEQRGDQARI